MTLAMTTAMAVLDVAEAGEPLPPGPQARPSAPAVLVPFPRSGDAPAPGRRTAAAQVRTAAARERSSGAGVPRTVSRPAPRRLAGPAAPAVARSGSAAPGRVRAQPARPAPVRLTRRGRVVAGGLALAAAVALAGLLSLALAGGAQAVSHGPARAGYQGMRQIVVQRGQSLWSIAAAAAPAADPRVVIPQIEQANSLGGSTVYAGETLWVPAG
ncbi:MAG TPA: LysM peptidoglycan-binding domain-containing protein [Streptosporangiaceae bacterium]